MSHTPIPPDIIAPHRSLLATPASSMKMIAKAHASAADAVFLDLEDSVAEDEKDSARRNAIQALKELDWKAAGKTVSLRINGLDTSHSLKDLLSVVAESGDRLDSVIIPKIGVAADLYAVDLILRQIAETAGRAHHIVLEALIETALGAQNLDEISRYNRDQGDARLVALHFGAGDFAASVASSMVDIGGLHADYPGDLWHGVLSRLVVAARGNGLQPMDSAYGDFNDPEGYEASARRAAALGMAGKWAIHPSQISLANAIFSPSASRLAEARSIISALDEAEAGGLGAATHQGRMIDAASIRMARRLLALAEAIESRGKN